MTYFVVSKKKCSACEGEGIILHPLWRLFLEEYGDEFEAEEAKNWIINNGFDDIPPACLNCPSCGGSGAKTTLTTLTEALKDIGVKIDDAAHVD